MARNQGGFTVVVKRSRRTIEKGAPSQSPAAPAFETSGKPMLRGWADATIGGAALRQSPAGGETDASCSEARRAAEKLFAPRKIFEPRVLTPIADASLVFEGAATEPAIALIAAFPVEAPASAAATPAPFEPAAQPVAHQAALVTKAPPRAAHRKRRRAERPAFPPGQNWREALPESCWPEEMRRAARRARRAARMAERKDEPVQ